MVRAVSQAVKATGFDPVSGGSNPSRPAKLQVLLREFSGEYHPLAVAHSQCAQCFGSGYAGTRVVRVCPCVLRAMVRALYPQPKDPPDVLAFKLLRRVTAMYGPGFRQNRYFSTIA